MTFHRILLLLIYFLCYLSILSNGYIFLYHTEDALSVQKYDCIYSQHNVQRPRIASIKFCRQLTKNQILKRDFNQSCYHGGRLWTFQELASSNILPFDVLKWSSSVEQADRYAKYLSNKYSVNVRDNYICQCIDPSSFGKFCEYQYFNESTSFEQAIGKQSEAIKHDRPLVGSQLHDNRPCYITLEPDCDSGLMCLDWRHICDGKQQCMGGIDEDNCEFLEFNECEDDEYRCANSMCIPEEYWLDGYPDCMDRTDEVNSIITSGGHCFYLYDFFCDENFCPYNQWSCGDGQCISFQTDRQQGILYDVQFYCKNLRDIQYMCEASKRNGKPFWTINSGYCLPFSLHYQNLSLDTTAKEDLCAYAVKCALSAARDEDCQCKNVNTCGNLVKTLCNNYFIPYPSRGTLLAPYIKMVYIRTHDWTDQTPDGIQFIGRIKCIGYQFVSNGSDVTFQPTSLLFDYRPFEYRICNEKYPGYRNYSSSHYDLNCWNNSKTFKNQPYQVSFLCEPRCISKYRVRDGIRDCVVNEEELTINNSCPRIQRHRLQCSSSELSCLLLGAIGNRNPSCSNSRDEFDMQTQKNFFENIYCGQDKGPACTYLKDYIQMSSNNYTDKKNSINDTISNKDLTETPNIYFQSYCDSFIDIKFGLDELPEFCQQWTCDERNYQCLSGQCISVDWICDGEWDCNDGSDEERIFIMTNLSEHNSRLMNLDRMKEQCRSKYRLNNTAFSNICNIEIEYPCLRNNVNDPLNFTANRPCINFTQIGDGKIDCWTGLDERNRLYCQDLNMLGFRYQLSNGECIEYGDIEICDAELYVEGIDNITCFHRRRFFKNGTFSDCNDDDDVMCLNDVCEKKARCNGIVECPFGEDEYRCYSPTSNGLIKIYRSLKTSNQSRLLARIVEYPITIVDEPENIATTSPSSVSVKKKDKVDEPITRVYEKKDSVNESIYETVYRSLPMGNIKFENDYLPHVCNRGVAVKYYTGHTVCFCPPSYYGSQCEFYSDRITISTHLDLTNYRYIHHQMEMIKILITFLFNEQIIDHTEYHVNPIIENENNYITFMTYLLYPRYGVSYQLKTVNRSNTRLYSVRFEAFNLYSTEHIEPVGVWKYLIDFDFLPSYRLAKILRFSKIPQKICLDNNICGKNGLCLEILNANGSSYFCSCHSGYYGVYCEFYDENCDNYCSNNSICKPNYDDQRPLCLCPASTFGDTCYLKNAQCRTNPCLNGGTCIANYDPKNLTDYTCFCTDLFQGDHCEYQEKFIRIQIGPLINSSLNITDITAATISYNDDFEAKFVFEIRHQQVYNALPSNVSLIYKQNTYAPLYAIMKIYGINYHENEPDYYFLYLYYRKKSINITINLTSENYCPPVQNLWYSLKIFQQEFNSKVAIFYYHRFCQAKLNQTKFMCFRDSNNICFCTEEFRRAECFLYNHSSDQCSICLSNGRCLKGELDKSNDFLCLCPRCHSGKQCQYSNEFMSFTLDSLITVDVQYNYRVFAGVYISIVSFIFLVGLFNNICSFLTFNRKESRKFGVGIYLLIASIIDSCTLLLLLLKVIHIILGNNGILFAYENLNRYSCKIISYFLSTFTRITYWLTSFVTLSRLYLVLFPTSQLLKNTHLPVAIAISTILIISCMHIHEALNYGIVVDYSNVSANVTICAPSYTDSTVLVYNRVNVIVQYFIPFLIQIISITLMIIQAACSRARSTSNGQHTFGRVFKKQLQLQKELYITPTIIILSSLPQIIISFSYVCTDLKQSWQRYLLLSAYFFSYSSQILGFILHVLPSTTFLNEFLQTTIGRKLRRRRN